MKPSSGETDGPNSVTTTHGIEVAAKAQLLEQRTDPGERGWVYAYQITITNVGDRPLTLRTRHWVITDANGERREVRGPGVVGEQPRLEPLPQPHRYQHLQRLLQHHLCQWRQGWQQCHYPSLPGRLLHPQRPVLLRGEDNQAPWL